MQLSLLSTVAFKPPQDQPAQTCTPVLENLMHTPDTAATARLQPRTAHLPCAKHRPACPHEAPLYHLKDSSLLLHSTARLAQYLPQGQEAPVGMRTAQQADPQQTQSACTSSQNTSRGPCLSGDLNPQAWCEKGWQRLPLPAPHVQQLLPADSEPPAAPLQAQRWQDSVHQPTRLSEGSEYTKQAPAVFPNCRSICPRCRMLTGPSIPLA